MKLESLKPGMVVYDVAKTRMGNTSLRTVSVWPVSIHETGDGFVIASWNNNAARKYGRHDVARWRKSKPVTVPTMMGGCRLATREEIAAMKAKQ